jgi:hypothetical protein
VRTGLESTSAPDVRRRCLALLGGVLGAYPPLQVFPPGGGIQEELPQCLLDRIEDSNQEVCNYSYDYQSSPLQPRDASGAAHQEVLVLKTKHFLLIVAK